MEKISKTLERLTNRQDFQRRYRELQKEVLGNETIQTFLKENSETVTEKMVERSLVNLYEYINEHNNCKNCPGLNNCDNLMKGFRPSLIISGQSIDLQYERCHLKVLADERKKQQALIDSLYVPQDILNASFENFEFDKGRLKASTLADSFVENYGSEKSPKGLYLYGKFGVGKSYLLGAIANRLAEQKIASMIVYVPEFVREMKSSIGDQTLNEKLDIIKKAPILMLDDIGAESMSSWVRDEVLGTVLQFRMLENLPTFFTSNFNYDELEYHLAYNQRGDEEKIKAARILERIKYLSKPVLVDGPNRRN